MICPRCAQKNPDTAVNCSSCNQQFAVPEAVSNGKLDTWRSYKPERILTEIYAKLLGLIITYWQMLMGCWQAPNRSLVKAKQVVEWMTPCLALALAGVVAVETVVGRTVQMMGKGCTINARKKRPNTYQLLADPQLNSS